LDIASGPCREFLNWPPESSIDVVALDNDPIAIDYVQQSVAPQLPSGTNLQVHRYNALRTRNASATIKKFGSFDLIYSVGLFDYLSDRHLVDILSGLRDTLNPDGVLYIAFKDTRQYDKTPYQWHLDWFFFQRTHEDVLDLYRQAGFDVDAIETSRDETGIIINFISRPVRSRIERVDTAASPIRSPKPQVPETKPINH
jgi:extracellular factor (EF) 3-hydroxypalmitic acid methyl ester biosynthesis protein